MDQIEKEHPDLYEALTDNLTYFPEIYGNKFLEEYYNIYNDQYKKTQNHLLETYKVIKEAFDDSKELCKERKNNGPNTLNNMTIQEIIDFLKKLKELPKEKKATFLRKLGENPLEKFVEIKKIAEFIKELNIEKQNLLLAENNNVEDSQSFTPNFAKKEPENQGHEKHIRNNLSKVNKLGFTNDKYNDPSKVYKSPSPIFSKGNIEQPINKFFK